MLKIALVARALGRDQQTIRRWDRLGLFTPRRDLAGHRVYSEQDIEDLRALASTLKAGRPPKAKQ